METKSMNDIILITENDRGSIPVPKECDDTLKDEELAVEQDPRYIPFAWNLNMTSRQNPQWDRNIRSR